MSYRGMHPGLYLRHAIMEPLDMRVTTVAKILSLSERATYQFLSGQQAVDEPMAERLGVFFNMTPSFWMDMQRAYDKHQDDRKKRDRKTRYKEMAEKRERLIELERPTGTPSLDAAVTEDNAASDSERLDPGRSASA